MTDTAPDSAAERGSVSQPLSVNATYVHYAVIRQELWSPACDREAVGWTVPMARDDPNQVTCPACLAFCEGVTA